MTLEIVVLVGLFMLLFGYRKLPDLGRALGEAPQRFSNAIKEDE